MKNKKLKLLLSIFTLLPCFGASSCIIADKPRIFKFDYSAYYEEGKTYSDYENSISFTEADGYNRLIDYKHDFIIFIENPYCLCAKALREAKYKLGEEEILNYTVDYRVFENSLSKKFNYIVETTPAMLLYNDGNLYKSFEYDSNRKMFEDNSGELLYETIKSRTTLEEQYHQAPVAFKTAVNYPNGQGFTFTGRIDDVNTSSVYRSSGKGGFLVLVDERDFASMVLLYQEVSLLYSGYNTSLLENEFRVGFYNSLLSDPTNSGVLSGVVDITKDLDYHLNTHQRPNYTVDEEGKYEYYYKPICYAYKKDGKFVATTEFNNYEELLVFVDKYKNSK